MYMPIVFFSIFGQILDYMFRILFDDKKFVERGNNIFVDANRNAFCVVFDGWKNSGLPRLLEVKTSFPINVVRVIGNFIINSDGHIIYCERYRKGLFYSSDDASDDAAVALSLFKFTYCNDIINMIKRDTSNGKEFLFLLSNGELYSIIVENNCDMETIHTNFNLISSNVKHIIDCSDDKYYLFLNTDNIARVYERQIDSLNEIRILKEFDIVFHENSKLIGGFIFDDVAKIRCEFITSIDHQNRKGWKLEDEDEDDEDEIVTFSYKKHDLSLIAQNIIGYAYSLMTGNYYLTQDGDVYHNNTSDRPFIKLNTPKITRFEYAWVNTGVETCIYGVCGVDVDGNLLYLENDILIKMDRIMNSKFFKGDPYAENQRIGDAVLLANNIR